MSSLKLYYNLNSYSSFDSIISYSKDKVDIIKIILEVSRIVLTINPESSSNEIDVAVVRQNKMQRLFLFRKNNGSIKSILSTIYPFKIVFTNSSALPRLFLGMYEIDNKITSFLLSTFTSIKNIQSFEVFFNVFEEEKKDFLISKEEEEACWYIVRYLFFFDPGYLRYDIDQTRADPHFHPLNHVDIFFSNEASVKFGLKREITIEELIEIIDRETQCYYIEKV